MALDGDGLRTTTRRRPTLEDIARQSGASLATVDRVINDRPGVRDRTRQRVLQVANRLGYLSIEPEPVMAGPPLTLDFVLPDGTNSFILNLARLLAENAASRPDVELRLHMIEGFNPAAMAAKLGELAGRSQGLGITALDHPLLREAIRSVIAEGTPVVTLASDITQVPRLDYVGIDNRAAGRLAGHLLGRFVREDVAKVALFAGSLSYRGHEEREMGFRHILTESHPGLAIVELREVSDDMTRGYEEARRLLERHPDLAGIYSIGGGVEGIARALEESGRGPEVVLIGHELTEGTRRLLVAGTIDALIDQNPRVEAREAIDLLVQAARGTERPVARPMRVHAIFRENLP
ncbi:LacI family DNA-binding transcriptional regulator [Acidisoma cellulosilytica]|uniref:LacI family DNA-binding transcriptional regulator n=1 Tax=Acidisoma cellulosilyticum TaxID=2802395 RepID=A0A963Z238_9PROT|nr:LacI family DNA-binding transcriptional regulator [Acidisoma cellulosilyticum]MCB8881196.1 LacI family DNA-binding transcriptional regulator [Acidisoma cellulosilyticum]